MSTSVQQVLEAFQRLTPEEQREAATVLIRNVADPVTLSWDDETLALIADQSFQEYDACEAGRNEN